LKFVKGVFAKKHGVIFYTELFPGFQIEKAGLARRSARPFFMLQIVEKFKGALLHDDTADLAAALAEVVFV